LAVAHRTGKSPAFQFYPKDFLSDANVLAMSLTELGAYWKLTCICWNEGSLPADVKSLARLLGIPAGHASRLWQAIAPCFKERDGRLTHPRLEGERKKQAEFRQRQADNGRKGGRPSGKGLGSSGVTQPQAKESSSSAISNLQSSSAKRVKTHAGPRDRWFLELWSEYPSARRQRGPMVEQAFNDQFNEDERVDEAVWSDMWQGLQSQKAGYEWRVKNVVPAMSKWLSEGQWRNRHDAAPVSTLVSEKTAKNLTAVAEFLKAGNE
jgi:uncharacterized protein YdaU (DUF1376 family)